MAIYKSSGLVNRDIGLLAPFVRTRALNAISQCTGGLTIFEGWRSAARQQTLYAQGRNSRGSIVTNAKPWESAHQYGLALDVAFLNRGQWTWNGDFETASKPFLELGFESLAPFEKAHFQILGGLDMAEVQRINSDFGLLALWEVIQENLGADHS